METVLVHHRHDGGHFGDLMPDRFGILTVEVVVTGPTGGWLALNDLPELFGGNQGADHTAMTGLTAAFLPRWGSRGTSLDRRRIGRRGLGGVGGVLIEPLLQVGDPAFQRLQKCPDGRLGLGRHRVPEGFRDRRRIAHAI
jgi:hypothetical protein